MKQYGKKDSTTTTKYSLTDTTIKKPRRLPSISILEFNSSPPTKTDSRRMVKSSCIKNIRNTLEALEFRSERRKKKVFKFKLHQEHDILVMSKKIGALLVDTPDDDYDCASDEEMIQSAVMQKHRELKFAIDSIEE